MRFFIKISVFIIAIQWCGEVKCKPFVRKKHFLKSFHLGFTPLHPKHFSLEFEKFTPFGTYEYKHAIKKRQIAQAELPNEVAADDPFKIPMTHLFETTEVKDTGKLPAEVLITSVIEPFEPGKKFSFLLPVDSEVVITPAVKDVLSSPVEVPLGSEPELKPDVVVPHSGVIEIVPQPLEIVPSDIKPIVPNIPTPIESTVLPVSPVPQVLQVPSIPEVLPVPTVLPVLVEQQEPPVILPPAVQNLNTPVVSPVINSFPIAPYLYTNIKGIPFYTPAANIIPFLTPAAVPIPEAALLPGPPSVITEVVPVIKEDIPIIKEEPPVVKEEIPIVVKEEPPPNFFVKSSRFVLYFGSMMLQMLSRFVNGEVNLNQLPLRPPLLSIQ